MFMKNKSALQLIFLVFITGCSTNVIDENDLVEKSSLAYLKNSEAPFSGKMIMVMRKKKVVTQMDLK